MSQPAMNPDEVKQILMRGATGDPTVIDAVREVFAANPTLAVRFGDLATASLQQVLDLTSASNPVAREAIGQRLDAMRAEMLPPGHTILERLGVEVILFEWALTHHYGVQLANRSGGTSSRLTMQADKLYQRAHRRLLLAIKSFAHTQKLLGRRSTTRGIHLPNRPASMT